MKPGRSSERAVILAPNGRDATVAEALIREAGYFATVCADFAQLVSEVESGAGIAVIADEAIKSVNLRDLDRWLHNQPVWSDFPIVLLTRQGGGPERNPDAARLRQVFGNVTFLERPFHPTTLISLVGSAVRGRRRQYQTREILEDLSDSQAQLQTALDAGRLGTLELHLPELRLEVSETTKACFGRQPHDSFTFAELQASIHPEDRAQRQRALDATLTDGVDYNVEYRCVWADGSVHWVETRARIVRGPDGRPKTLVGVSVDITTRKTADIERDKLFNQLTFERAALAELTATLEQRVEERTVELVKESAARERAQEQLRQAQKMETIGQLTGGVAHDFNNLLMAVMGNLELLRKRMPDDPRLKRLVDGAMQGAERGASLTQRLLAFARQQDLRAEAVDLGTLVRGMSDLLDRSLGPRIALEFDIPEGLPPARIDANQLELAILNLVINARDAMEDGGAIAIKLASHSIKRSVGALKAGDYLKVSIIDNGEGMSPETLKKAIEPFFSTKPVGKGTGLGLSMVHGLAEQLGGTLELTSKVGQGTTATLIVPATTAAPVITEEVEPERQEARSAVILFVDDDPLIAMSTAEMLEDLGHKVIPANSGRDALDILRSAQPIDLMMTDHMMPGMTGIELAAQSREVRPMLPILLATGYADLPEGAHLDLPRLAKPYHQDQLRDRLEQLLG
ncbi:ATP-binding protein [Tardiphaga sp.]|uniref:hybrid sensor histidine kinase/response regulator n=1 Tax=Tardiphaga sp. TaxID=1926292 RepID=UPI0037D9EF50